ncbi:MAG TPA: hypothetical protein VHV79_02920 [Mycobacteriales bacterium]|jgi:hypothetical protein|nr:hypothetical protein [Mycobacteriales bacterium]
MKLRPTYSAVTATIALVLSLGGVGFAATRLPANSVGTPQLKANAVTSAKVKNHSLTGSDVKPNSLTGSQVRASTLGKVPSAGTADNSTKLGGHPASDFLKGGDFITSGDLASSYGSPEIGTLPGAELSGTVGTCGVGDENIVNFGAVAYQQANATATEDDDCIDGMTGITTTRPGIYAITASVSWSADSSGDRRLTLVDAQDGDSCDDFGNGTGDGDTVTLAVSEVPPVTVAGNWTQQNVSTIAPIGHGDEICVEAVALGVTTGPGAAAVNDVPGTNLSMQFMSGPYIP